MKDSLSDNGQSFPSAQPECDFAHKSCSKLPELASLAREPASRAEVTAGGPRHHLITLPYDCLQTDLSRSYDRYGE
jgi:hypothetical protein